MEQNYVGTLKALIESLYNGKGFNDDATNALRDWIKKFIVYATDVKDIESSDISTDIMKELNQKLKKSKFSTKRKKLRGVAVEEGLSAIVFSIVKGKVFFDVYKVRKPFLEVADTLTEIFVYKDGDTINNGSKTKQVFYKFKSTEGKTVKTQYTGDINGKPSSFELTSDKYNEYDVMPVVVLPNNEDYESTFQYAGSIIETAGKHLNNIDSEWEYDKAMLINQNFFEPTRDGDTLQSEIEGTKTTASGKQKKVFDTKDPNGLGATSIGFLSSGGVSSQVAQRNYDKFKQEALFYTLSWLVVSDGKTNKHGAEVITSQVPTFNHIEYQIELLSEFYSHFLFILHNLMILTNELESEKLEEVPTVDVALSKYMEAILDMTNKDGENNAVKTPKSEEK